MASPRPVLQKFLVVARDNEFNGSILRAITRQRKVKFLSTDFIF